MYLPLSQHIKQFFNLQICFFILAFSLIFSESFQSFFMINNSMKLDYDRENKRQVNKIFQSFRKGQELNFQPGLFYKAFLRPFQVCLKTWQTEYCAQKIGSLPYGLKQVIRKQISGNNYIMCDFHSIAQLPSDLQKTHSDICSQNYDNMISLLKASSQDPKIPNSSTTNLNNLEQIFSLQIAICISMFSEDSLMLHKTLNGVKNNINQFIEEGVSADRIGVFVFMDGIEHVHESMEKFYEQLEIENDMFFDEKRNKRSHQSDFLYDGETNDDEKIQNGEMAFNDEEFNDLYDRRFIRRKTEYLEVKKVFKEISQLQKLKQINFDALSVQMQDNFIERAKQHHKELYFQDDDDIKKRERDYFVKNYVGNNETYKTLIRQTLNETKKKSLQYFEKREKMAIVNTFRVQIDENRRRQNEYQMVEERQDISEMAEEQYLRARSRKRFMNLFMVTKYKNGGKLSSHNWFFNGFCRELKTKYAILLDVGLKPDTEALVKMYKHMENNDIVGGVCGYMAIKRQPDSQGQKDWFSCLYYSCFDIQKAQQVEYHYSHLVDKPFESIFCFVHVLPGAFSGYRMKALQPNENQDSELLREYFKSLNNDFTIPPNFTTFSTGKLILKIVLPDFLYNCCYQRDKKSEEQLLYNENVYLAEDRTLCMGIHLNRYRLSYLPDSYSEVDPMKTLPDLLGQRKRWINGSFFAFQQVKNTYESSENCCCTWLKFQINLLTLLNSLAYIAPALFLITIYMSIKSMEQKVRQWFFPDDEKLPLYISESMKFPIFLFIIYFFSLVYLSMFLNQKHQYITKFVDSMSTFLGLTSFFAYCLFFHDIVRIGIAIANKAQPEELLFLVSIQKWDLWSTYVFFCLVLGMFFLHTLPILTYMILYRERLANLCRILHSLISFIFYMPTYLIILNTYALARIDDVSWGTKGLSEELVEVQKNKKKAWKSIKIIQVSKFLFWNIIFSFAFMSVDSSNICESILKKVKFSLIAFIIAILFITLAIKSFLALIYFIYYSCCCCCNTNNLPLAQSQESFIWTAFDNLKQSLYEQIKNNIEEHILKEQEIQRFAKDSTVSLMAKQKRILKIKFQSVRKQKYIKEERIRNSKIEMMSSIRLNTHFLKRKKKFPVQEMVPISEDEKKQSEKQQLNIIEEELEEIPISNQERPIYQRKEGVLRNV